LIAGEFRLQTAYGGANKIVPARNTLPAPGLGQDSDEDLEA